MRQFALLILVAAPLSAHDAHGRSNAPPEARRLKSPLAETVENVAAAQPIYARFCASCHGADGKARTTIAAKLPLRPTNLAEYVMESMRDGEIFWVVTHGIDKNMPSFDQQLTETERWQLVQYVRDLRARQRTIEKAELGPYEWNLPAGFPFPNVPKDNPMTAEKVALGRYLFYDKRLSMNQTQSCATCHQQALAFTDGRAHGLGSTKQLHPRGPMSLANVAYAPVLTWANPNVRTLEKQALVPMFGEDPEELAMEGKEDVLLSRLRIVARYTEMFAAAFPGDIDPFTVANVTKAIASFERTILSGDSLYDRYRVGDDPNAISESAKRGEALFFSEKLECFHCHGGFNFTGTVDYLDKGFAEVEFHNTGLYNLTGKFSYPEPNLGLYLFTQRPEDVGRFKAPTLRNISITTPYMHDGSVKTLDEAIDHYSSGGRTLKAGPNAGVGADNPNKSEFVKQFELTAQEKADLTAFLRSLTDESFLTNPQLSNPWQPNITRRKVSAPQYVLRGEVVQVYPEDGMISLYYKAVPGLIAEMKRPNAKDFLVPDQAKLKALKPGQAVTAHVRKQGHDYVLEDLRPIPPGKETNR